MVELAQKHLDQLDRLKENVEKSHDYFKRNNRRWHEFKEFLYVTSLTDADLEVLRTLNKPELEFNILEAYVSRQKGEFAKQEPSIKIQAGSGEQVDPKVIEAIEGHIRSVEKQTRDDNVAYDVYDDMLAGGYSVVKVWADYVNEMSFDIDLNVSRAFDPTLCGFDPLAMKSHKGDGEYCFELHVLREKEFKETYPNVDVGDLTFTAELEGFSWSYKTSKEKIVMLADYYEKKIKKVKIVKLSDGRVMTTDEYEKFLVEWEMSGKIQQPAQPVGEPRATTQTKVVRYRFIENKVIGYKETPYRYLPLVFFDGDSVVVRRSETGPLEQVTRPYCYQAQGVQRLKNFCGQTLANEIENMIQHKFKLPKEGIPAEYASAYTNYQIPSVLVYNQFKDNNPDVRLDPPQEIARIPTPPEIGTTFMGADQTTQAILGSYDAALGINNNELSGIAITEAATQSNAAAMPYIVGYLDGLNQVAQIILDLIPKYYTTPRSIPVLDKDGNRQYMLVNDTGQPSMQYDANALNVEVNAGVNFAIQRSRALQQITALMQASEMFANFINNTPQGLNALLDNIEMRGIDKLKESVDQFLQQQAQQAKQQQQQAMMQNPAVIRAQVDMKKMQQESQEAERRDQISVGNLAVSDKQADTDSGVKENASDLQAAKLQAENARTAVDMAIKTADMEHRHKKETDAPQ